jgi:hypothetical protein
MSHAHRALAHATVRITILVILYLARSDILTPLTALGVPFDIDDNKGPLIDNPIRTMEQVDVRACVHWGPTRLGGG